MLYILRQLTNLVCGISFGWFLIPVMAELLITGSIHLDILSYLLLSFVSWPLLQFLNIKYARYYATKNQIPFTK
jgi:hypothetical protein